MLETVSLQHYPISLERFGKNPYGEPLYRIIFAPTRRSLGGNDAGIKEIPTYRAIGDQWVLEKWVSAFDFCQMSEAKWNEQYLTILGPYPSRGEYIHAFTFEACSPEDANLDKLISWLTEGKARSYQDHIDAIRGGVEARDKEHKAMIDAVVRDRWTAFGMRPFSGGHVSRGTKTVPLTKSANELGLPTEGKFVTLSRE